MTKDEITITIKKRDLPTIFNCVKNSLIKYISDIKLDKSNLHDIEGIGVLGNEVSELLERVTQEYKKYNFEI